ADTCGSVPRVGNATPEQVADVRGDGVDLAAVAIDGERERLAIWEPEVAIEANLQVRRLALQALGKSRVIPEGARQAGDADLGIVDVALDLAGRTRQLPHRAIGEQNAVPVFFPGLLLE